MSVYIVVLMFLTFSFFFLVLDSVLYQTSNFSLNKYCYYYYYYYTRANQDTTLQGHVHNVCVILV